MKLDVQNSNLSVYIVTCNNLNCPWRLYARALTTGTWKVSTNLFQHIYYGHATKGNYCQMASKIIADRIKPQLCDNLDMTVSHPQGVW
jgi:hypothetical protein